MQLGAMHNIYYSYFGQSTRMVDSGIFIDKICWFYPNRESTFWTMHAILKLQVPILAMRNNKMGHRINKMWTLINKVGHRNVKLVVTYQQVGFKKQQNGSRVLYQNFWIFIFYLHGLAPKGWEGSSHQAQRAYSKISSGKWNLKRLDPSKKSYIFLFSSSRPFLEGMTLDKAFFFTPGGTSAPLCGLSESFFESGPQAHCSYLLWTLW